MSSTTNQTWTTRKLLGWMNDAFVQKDLDSPRRMAEMLMAHVLGTERLKLYMDPDRPASPLELDTLRGLVKRALNHEPIQYLVGEESFFTMRFKVDQRVLIPRPSTQTIVEEILQHSRANLDDHTLRDSDAGRGIMIADICTGSGCIAAALAKHLPGCRVIATDISQDALDCAKENLELHDLTERVELIQGNLLEPILKHPVASSVGSFRYIASNPPYIPDDEWDAVEANVKDHEPTIALRANDDGMEFVNPLIEHAPPLLAQGGLLLIELATARTAQALERAKAHPMLTKARIVKDSDGMDRVLIATRNDA
ncbi:MAG: peptide chain release factor N(5)-glutamine methyltransferase [Phycisphaerales bacterium]